MAASSIAEPGLGGPASPAAERSGGGLATAVLSRVAIAAAAGLCAGAGLGDAAARLPWLLAIGLACGLVALAAGRRRLGQTAQAAWLLALGLAAAQVGVWRMQAAQDQQAAARSQVQRFSGVQQVRGLVADDPIPRGRSSSLRLGEVVVRDANGWQPLGANVLVNVPRWPEHDSGEYLQLRGRLQPLNGGGAIEALARQGVLASMSYPRVSYLANPQANPFLTGIARLRQRLGDVISQTLPEPEASTLRATVLGIRTALPKDQQQALVNTGTVHLVVISGFKLTLIAAALQIVGLWLLRRTTERAWARLAVSLAVVAALGGYTLLTGATPSAVRAAIMAGLVTLAALAGRPRDQLAALGIAVLAIVGLRPFELLDGGFQLSCLSVLGIVLLAQPLAVRLRRPLARLPQDGWAPNVLHVAGFTLAEAVAASVAATLFILPVLAGSFHVVSLVSPLANLAGMPLLGPIMAFGGLGAALGAIWAPLGAALLWPAWAFTALLDQLVQWTAGLPYAALATADMAPAATAAYYAGLAALTAWLGRSVQPETARPIGAGRRLRWAAMAAAAVAVVVLSVWVSRPPSTLRATLLALPGQAALIQTPAGGKVLVDGGESGAELLRQLGQLLPPWDRSLDLVLITNSRTDYVGGLEEVFARYRVAAVIEPDVDRPTATFRRLQAGIRRVVSDSVDLGDGAVLDRRPDGWRLTQGQTSVLVGERSFDVQMADGSWRILPIIRGSRTQAPGEDAISLADTGNVTVSFGAASPLN